MTLIPLPVSDVSAPAVELQHLDALWFQVSGTVCNLTCTHCFISCGPKNHSFRFLSLPSVAEILEEAKPLGVKEFYFTGGEPFLNKDMVPILKHTLRYGPATVLTNGTVLKEEWLIELANAETESRYSLEFRVSIDGFTAEQNDPIRGNGTFGRIIEGIDKLVNHGFLPIITVARTDDEQDDGTLFHGFEKLLHSIGYSRPRIKILPTLRLGAETERQRGYHDYEVVTHEMMENYDQDTLLCSSSRLVSDMGVHVCPILLEAREGLLGQTLSDSLVAFPLRFQACYTCYQFGALCSNTSTKPNTEG